MVLELLVKFVTEIWRAIWRAVDVKSSAPEEPHAPTEYADAFFFGGEDHSASNSSSPPSIIDGDRH